MAASVTATMGVVSIVPVKTGFSSSASFGAPLVSVAPLRSAAKRNVMITRAAIPEEHSGKTARREMLASLMAAGAVIATAGQSIAASGPGIPGAERTQEKAKNLLQNADELTKNESPPRFGGRVGGDETDKIAQSGGAGVNEEIQGAAGGAVQTAKDNVAEAKKRLDSVFGKKTGDLSDASGIFDSASGKVKSDIDTTKEKVKSDVDTVQGGSFFSDAQKALEGATGGKNSVGELVDNIKSGIPQ